ncbi:LodA/GoxA family CTQ-dependent oxidase [Bradyrhizobium sp. NAS96.2]|uniref:LodA/GoxA family CTQ-dependent oxidase n=1 Tax=Bradyrhizobium sp. NAS96.2 TaxID=1680160 RepID=UPI0011615213|nr:LodA/GoxA family CTQ-dependent oxidase [Bradyrhizobium sp. NAS96.2]
MALPHSTSLLKVHPAVGFARLSTNPEFYEFGSNPQANYKSNDLIKRQAVRFRIFAYDANNNGIQELPPAWLAANGIHAVWHARVANRKIARLRSDDSYVISANAQSNVGGGRLTGRCGNFDEGQNIDLGTILPDGSFIPPLAQVYARQTGASMEQGGFHNPDFADNTSDGIISVELIDQATNARVVIPTLDAWIVVAPQDFAPDWDDVGDHNLLTYLTELLALPNQPPANAINQQARAIDRSVLESGTAIFSPGIEVNLQGMTNNKFYTGAALGDQDEVRVRPGSSIGGPGTLPGELTEGLCSPWQFDFLACTCYWWPNSRPDIAFRDDANGPVVNWLRRNPDELGPNPASGALSTRSDIVRHVDKLGIIRKDSDKHVEKERTNDIPPEVA